MRYFYFEFQFVIVVVLLYFDNMLMEMVMCLLLLDLYDLCLIRANGKFTEISQGTRYMLLSGVCVPICYSKLYC